MIYHPQYKTNHSASCKYFTNGFIDFVKFIHKLLIIMFVILFMWLNFKLLFHRTVFPLVKGIKDSIKLIQRDWRSETSLTAFPLSGFSVRAGGNSSILRTVCRTTLLRFLTPPANSSQYFSLLKRILEFYVCSYFRFSKRIRSATHTVIGTRFVNTKRPQRKARVLTDEKDFHMKSWRSSCIQLLLYPFSSKLLYKIC